VPLASVSSSLTTLVGDHGLYAVFALMVVAAVLPAASEIVMIYAGAVAAGAFAGAHVVLFGSRISTPAWAYVAMALAGLAGNTVGALVGWSIGWLGGRPLLERYGRLLHVTPARLDRAERWFARFGPVAVPLGFAAPIVRSFVAIPAGIARMRLGRFLALAIVGCAAFCFGLAGAGWAVGKSYERFHHDFRFVDYAVLAVVVLVAVWLLLRWRTARRGRLAAE
jgi:membrane protein DedA with SNARE-associated domain